MSATFRVRSLDGEPIGEADTMDGVLELAGASPPGHYRIDKIWLDPATGEVRSWEWGEVIKDRAGEIKLDLPPWVD